jgi:Zn-dependent protease/CBS domain-containing protein
MRSGFKVADVFGIEIRIDWSWILIFLLVTWQLITVFGDVHPNWTNGLRWGIALAAALLFFASVLAHELAHSLTARAQGMPVRRITLFLFGGVSNLERHPPSPRAEFLITIVGPATSIVLGVIFLALGSLQAGSLSASMSNPTGALQQLGPLATLLFWLGPVNILVGIFNLIPGFPLDGGRVLRSILWAITDNLTQATRWASFIGQGVAWLFIAAGIAMAFGIRIPFFGQGLLSGLWLAFIGWFLNSASSQSYQQILVEDILEDVPVSRVMRKNPPTVPPTSSIYSLVHDHIMGTDDHSFPVVDDDGKLLGLVTLDDVREISRNKWQTTTIKQAMTPAEDLITISPDAQAHEALSKLRQRDVGQIPVLDNGELVGLIRRQDIVRYLQLQSDRKHALGT